MRKAQKSQISINELTRSANSLRQYFMLTSFVNCNRVRITGKKHGFYFNLIYFINKIEYDMKLKGK